jgi:pectin methylesterase-like acyl-CoA thioesterase
MKETRVRPTDSIARTGWIARAGRVGMAVLVGASGLLTIPVLTPPATVHAANLTVCADGCGFSSVQAAVDAAAEGDTVSIGGGTYTEAVSITKSISLAGAGRAATVLDGQHTLRPLTISAGVVVAITDLTITRGMTTARGGGIANAGTLTLDRVEVSDSRAMALAAGAVGRSTRPAR